MVQIHLIIFFTNFPQDEIKSFKKLLTEKQVGKVLDLLRIPWQNMSTTTT